MSFENNKPPVMASNEEDWQQVAVSDTPLTDAATELLFVSPWPDELIDLARELERQLAAAQAEIERLKKQVQTYASQWAWAYAKECGYPETPKAHIHFTHYDDMKAAGCRMDEYVRFDPKEGGAR